MSLNDDKLWFFRVQKCPKNVLKIFYQNPLTWWENYSSPCQILADPEVKPVPFINNLLLLLDPLDFQTFHSSNLLWIAENAIYFQPVFIMCCLEKVAGGNCSWACTVVRGELFSALLYNTVVKFEICIMSVILKSMKVEWWKPIYFVQNSYCRGPNLRPLLDIMLASTRFLDSNQKYSFW